MNDNNKLEELSFLLPVLGIILFSPMLLMIFDNHITIFGIPFLHIYLFTCWLALIYVSYRLTRLLPVTTNPVDQPRETEEAVFKDIDMNA
ncbi:MAG: hypothetical protein ACRBBN_10685 [Methyloligellaceae bacterium]